MADDFFSKNEKLTLQLNSVQSLKLFHIVVTWFILFIENKLISELIWSLIIIQSYPWKQQSHHLSGNNSFVISTLVEMFSRGLSISSLSLSMFLSLQMKYHFNISLVTILLHFVIFFGPHKFSALMIYFITTFLFIFCHFPL